MADVVMTNMGDVTPTRSGWFNRKVVGLLLAYVALLFAMVVILFPLLWMFLSSFKGQSELFARDMTLLPNVWTWENYVNVWFNTPFPLYFWNSFYIAGLTTLFTVFVAIYAAYAIARLEFKGRKAFGLMLLITQMFPHIMLVLPLFAIIKALGLFNTHIALIIAYTAFSLPFSIWMLRSFFAAIPTELEDAAAVDGASLMSTLHKVILPLVGPGIAAVAMYTFIQAWNEFLFALVFLQSQSLRTLPLGLASFQEEFTLRWDLMMAGGSIVSLPVLIFFLFMQRFIVQGLLGGAVKG
ncbi:carbohydrate ABC transporter permease [Devosia sp. 2618]|uniref:carbohydrate ABC transporter permease n=1 Tax=Devosia sp. 2618 TaxID=3156454 RepID=UPI003392A420